MLPLETVTQATTACSELASRILLFLQLTREINVPLEHTVWQVVLFLPLARPAHSALQLASLIPHNAPSVLLESTATNSELLRFQETAIKDSTAPKDRVLNSKLPVLQGPTA